MEFDTTWLLLGLPLAFAFGWAASRLDLRQLRTENRSAPKAYFKGLNHLLNEQQDQAIDAFIEAVQKDPDTSELHFALGNLFRRRGEYERATRVHQHLLARADLPAAEHDRAHYALALDFLKAGLLDHAESTLHKLGNSSFASQAQMALLGIYERSRDWTKAGETAQALERSSAADFSERRAHYLCEQALAAQKGGDMLQARQLLQQASQLAPGLARPRLQLAQLEQSCGNAQQAYALLHATLQESPACAPLAARQFAELGMATRQAAAARSVLQELQHTAPSIDLVEAMALLDAPLHDGECAALASTAALYLEHLEHAPSLMAATRWLEQEKLAADPRRKVVQRALHKACAPLARYRCAACGFEAQQHYWQCPGCQNWGSYPFRRVEEL